VLRIVIDARSVVAKKSGVGNYVAALVRHMVPRAPDVEFLLLRHPDAAPLLAHERVRELCYAGETKSLATVFRLGRRHSFRDFQLYHSPADLVPLGLECPYVVTLHDLMWIEAPRLASAFLPVRVANAAWYRWNIGRAVEGAAHVISISEATRSAIERVYPEALPKLTVIHHGLDHAHYAAAQAAPRTALEPWLPAGDEYSLIVGQGSPYKNHAGMLRAFVEATRDRPKHKLVLIRRFSRVDFEMQALLRRPEVSAKLIAIPFVDDDLLLSFYRHARMLLFASHYEGFGLPALEAMALGTPVLASTAPAVLEVTGDAALHAEPADHADLVAKIRQLDRDQALRAALIAAGTAHVRKFSWDRAADRTLDVYRKAIAGAGQPRTC
jgi:glycosyltransferase involved in cell wall biosynthesis